MQKKERLELDKISNVVSFLSNFEIQRHFQNEPKFNAVYSRNRLHNRKLNSLHNNEVNSLPKIKDRTYLTKLDEYKSIGT